MIYIICLYLKMKCVSEDTARRPLTLYKYLGFKRLFVFVATDKYTEDKVVVKL